MPNTESLKVHTVVSELFEENCYIASLTDRQDCLVVDPGLNPRAILQYLDQNGLRPAVILNTHGHSDHIAGNGALKLRWPEAPLVIGAGDAEKLLDPRLNLSAWFGVRLVSPPADRLVHEGEVLEYAGFRLEVREAPGHCQGHVVFVWHDGTPTVVFGGDVLMAGSVGRTDFPDGDMDALVESIRSKLYTLPDDTLVLPGHGPETTIGHEKQTNPFVRAAEQTA